jgi:ribosomal small subunit protein bTHX
VAAAAAAVATAAAALRSAGKPLAGKGRSSVPHGMGDRPFSLDHSIESELCLMGKGDHRSRRGKIYQGSFGKTRVKNPAKKKRRAAKKASKR